MLKLNGKPFVLRPPSSIVGKIKDALDRSPADEIYTGGQVAAKANLGHSSVSDHGAHADLRSYTQRSGNFRYWGNPKAITDLRKQLEAVK